MNRKSLYLPLALSFAAGIFSFFLLPASFAQGTAFFYQGQLNDGGGPANGSYNMQFTAYNALTAGQAVSGTVTNYAVGVSNGLFTTIIDFGTNVFTGPNLWLGIGVCTNGTNVYTFLSPRQPILPVPYAIFANSASNLVGVLPSSQLSGTLPASAFTGYTGTVAFTNGADIFSGSFSGNGAGVTNVSVTNLTGVLADAQLPSNTAYVNSNQTFTAMNTFTGNNTFTASNTFNGANTFTNLYANSFSGSFFGNGLVGWIAVTGTTVQASIDHGYLLTNQLMDTVTLPPTANVGDIVRIAGAGAAGWEVAQNAGQSVLGNFITYGKTWAITQQNGQWISMASSSDGTKMIASDYGVGLYTSVNSGASWGKVLSSPVSFASVASSSDGTHLAAVVDGGDIYISTNSGSTWAGISSGNFTGVAASASGNQFVAVAAGQGIATFSTTANINTYVNGNNWSAVASSASGNNLVATVDGGGIYTSANAGVSWAGPYASTQDWTGVTSSSDGTRLAAVVSTGGIYTSVNSGVTWTATSAPSTSWASIAGSSDGSKLIAVASDENIYTSPNWGATWIAQTNNVPTGANWECCASSASGSTLAAGVYNATSGYLYTSQDASQVTTSTVGTSGYISGSQGTSVELQYIGNGQFMPVSSVGTIFCY